MPTAVELVTRYAGSPPAGDVAAADILAACRRHSTAVHRYPLAKADGSGLRWLAGEAHGAWEDATFEDAAGTALTPDAPASDPSAGFWSFSTAQTAVLLTGRRVDAHAAAADVLALLLALSRQWKGEWVESLKLLIRYHQARSQPRPIEAVRDDIWSATGADQWRYGPPAGVAPWRG